VTALRDILGGVAYAVASHGGRFQFEHARDVSQWLVPFRALEHVSIGRTLGLCVGMLDLVLGRWEVTRRESRAALAILRTDRVLSEFDRRIAEGTARYTLAFSSAIALDGEHEVHCEAIDALGLRFQVAATLARTTHHRMRGDEAQARAGERVIEASIVQRGAGWLFEPLLFWASGLAYAVCRDVGGLRRVLRELEMLEARIGLNPLVTAIVRGEYLREVGRLDAARVELETAHRMLPDGDLIAEPWILTALSETWLALDAPELAWTTAQAASTLTRELEHPVLRCRAACALAAAESALGSPVEAAQRVAHAIAIADATSAPSLRTAAHVAAASIAYREGERARYEHHRVLAVAAARDSANPALVSWAHRLADLARTKSTPAPALFDPPSRALREIA
jgi:hypothetical protein